MNYKIDVTAYQTSIEFDTREREEIPKEMFIRKLKESLKTFSLCDAIWLGSMPKVCYELTREYKSEFLACLRVNLSIRFDEMTKEIEADLNNIMKLLFKHTNIDIWFNAEIVIAERNADLSNTDHINISTQKVFNVDLKSIKDFKATLKIMKAEVKLIVEEGE